jgi:hypothetical protein
MIKLTAKEFLNELGIENRGVLGCNFSGHLTGLLDRYFEQKVGEHFLWTQQVQEEIVKEFKKRGILNQ